MEKSPGDANCSEGLHHFEVTGGGCASQPQSFEVNEKWDGAGDRGEEKKCDDGCGDVRSRGWWPKGNAIQFFVDQKNESHADQSNQEANTGSEALWQSVYLAATGRSG